MEGFIIWIALGIIVFAALLLLLVGFALSARQQVTRVELVKAPLAEVWEALTNLPAQAYWREDLKSVQMLDDDHGLRWVEHPEKGQPLTVRKLKEKLNQELLLEMVNDAGKGTRNARLSGVPGGTRITFTEVLDTNAPLKRIRARMKGGLDKKLDYFIQQLKQKFVPVA